MGAVAARVSSRVVTSGAARKAVTEVAKAVSKGARKAADVATKALESRPSSSGRGPKVEMVSESKMHEICDRNFQEQIERSAEEIRERVAHDVPAKASKSTSTEVPSKALTPRLKGG